MITTIQAFAMTRDRLRARIEAQGFTGLDDATLAAIDPWLRVAPALCLVWTALGAAFQSPLLLWLLAAVSMIGVFDRVHPFDAIYNHVVRHRARAPALPAYRAPRRFAFGVAAALLTASGCAFAAGHAAAAYLYAGVLLFGATVAATTGHCIASYVFGAARALLRQRGPQCRPDFARS